MTFSFFIRYLKHAFTHPVASRFQLSQLEDALTLLGDRLRLAGLPPQEIVVCGGTSLIARGFVSRATKDVDILARRTPGTDA